jgi:hypothetical protein
MAEFLAELLGALLEGGFELLHWKAQLGCLALGVLMIGAIVLWVYFG